jgi:hypothetical protein
MASSAALCIAFVPRPAELARMHPRAVAAHPLFSPPRNTGPRAAAAVRRRRLGVGAERRAPSPAPRQRRDVPLQQERALEDGAAGALALPRRRCRPVLAKRDARQGAGVAAGAHGRAGAAAEAARAGRAAAVRVARWQGAEGGAGGRGLARAGAPPFQAYSIQQLHQAFSNTIAKRSCASIAPDVNGFA